MFKKFTLYYNNIRGIKSKLESLKEIIIEKKPHIICLNETLLGEEEKVEIEDYEIMYNSKREGKMGTLIGIHKMLVGKSVILEKISEEYEAFWIQCSNNNNIKMRIGNIYAPQENRTKKSIINKMYSNIKKHSNEAKKLGEKILVVGDFNAKIGEYIQGNKKEVSKNGEKLLEMIKQEELELLNKNDKCNGVWTRIEGINKSVIDYVIVAKEDDGYLNEMLIDQEKVMTPFHIKKGRTIYSDHCAIAVSMNWWLASKVEKEKEVEIMNSETLAKFKKETSGNTLTKIVEENCNIKEKYKKWNICIKKVMEKCFTKKKRIKKTRPMILEKLYKQKRRLKKERREKQHNMESSKFKTTQIILLNEYIEEEEGRIRRNLIYNNIRSIEENGGINSNAFWDFKRRMDKKNNKKETLTAMKNKEGNLETDIEKIKDIFKDFYVELFEPNNKSNTNEEKMSEEVQEILFKSLMVLEENEDGSEVVKISREEVENAVMVLKRKQTKDSQGWSNSLLLNAGDDFIDSLTCIMNCIDEEKTIPDEWKDLIIRSISKGSGLNYDVGNRRGLFITNIASKIYERIKLNRKNDDLNKGISRFQCGGKKGRSTIDHIMTLNSIIDYNKLLKSESYILFADAYKCFDKLSLRNCIIDIAKVIGTKEAMNLYRLNEQGSAIIKTPAGEIGPIKADEIVRQGTIWGPKLCCINTDKVNTIGRKCLTYIGPEVKVETLIYVDDIQNASSNVKQLENAVDNLKRLENQKGYIFNNKVQKTAIMIMDKKKNKEYKINASVKMGEIKQTNQYKYLGEWFNDKGDHSTSIEKRKEKVQYLINQIMFYGNEFILGRYTILTRVKIYKTMIYPALFHNVETWSIINNSDLNELEKMQAVILKRICGQIITTPYFGIMAELGIWPVGKQVEYKRLMLLHNILKSDDNRVIKEIIKYQIENTWRGCWMQETKEILRKNDIDITKMAETSKEQMKKKIKDSITLRLQTELSELKKEKTKLRFIEKFEQKRYLEELTFEDTIEMMKLRLNMMEVKCNYKGKYKNNLRCEVCNSSDDTTEHILQCKQTGVSITKIIEDIKQPNYATIRDVNKVMKEREVMGVKTVIVNKEGDGEAV